MNNFSTDDAWQKMKRDTILAPQFYGNNTIVPTGRYVFMDKGRLAKILQRRMEVDTILQGKDGAAVAIEEKIVRWPGYRYPNYCLETKSCTVPGHESDGWMVYGQADYLLYCFEQESGDLDCHLIDFQKLKAWFWPRESGFKPFKMSEQNQTFGRQVPIAHVEREVGVYRVNCPVWLAA